MEFTIQPKDGALPCEVTIDEDNGRYMIRKADTSGEVFNSPQQLVYWIKENWTPNQFENPEQYEEVMQEIENYVIPDTTRYD